MNRMCLMAPDRPRLYSVGRYFGFDDNSRKPRDKNVDFSNAHRTSEHLHNPGNRPSCRFSMGKCPVVAREGSMARWPITANSLPLLNQHMAWHVSERDARGPHAVCHARNVVRETLLLHTSPCYLACIGSRHAWQTSNPALNPIVPTTSCRDTNITSTLVSSKSKLATPRLARILSLSLPHIGTC